MLIRDWPDVLRSAATMAAGTIPLSQLLRKLAAYPRQHDLGLALREIGRIERTVCIIDWLLDAELRRRAQMSDSKIAATPETTNQQDSDECTETDATKKPKIDATKSQTPPNECDRPARTARNTR